MTDPNKSASEPLAQRAVSEQPAQEPSQLTIENVAGLGFDNELIRFAVFHTNGSIWEAADVLLRFESRPDKGNAVGLLEFALWIAENDQIKALKILARFRSGTLTQSDTHGTAISRKSIEKANNETTQKQSTLEEMAYGGKGQNKEVAENGDGASTITNAAEEANATLPSNKTASVVEPREAPTSCWSPDIQSRQSKGKEVSWSLRRDMRSITSSHTQKTTMKERQHVLMSNNSQGGEPQKTTNSSESKSNMDLTTIQTEIIIAGPMCHTEIKAITAAMKEEAVDVRKATTNPEKSASGSSIKRKLEIIEISDDDDDDDEDDNDGTDVDTHDSFQLKEENGATENIAADNASAKNGSVDDDMVERSSSGYYYDSTHEQEPNLSPLVNEKAWRVKKNGMGRGNFPEIQVAYKGLGRETSFPSWRVFQKRYSGEINSRRHSQKSLDSRKQGISGPHKMHSRGSDSICYNRVQIWLPALLNDS
ncbi:uncharacterized protein EAF02_008842 [Botrytis sinoallii]|uniref:uncharacterized protein n=1 Tax=Botrytis sinoallii TaxID=1463999 RepID=UPI00190067A1|nr:uncharacterized protein EAF02_008842 [Botrytis sinoallii]KAF7872771.1 hypothetical protein EAF02_008842 [Botrytis sinoallii]